MESKEINYYDREHIKSTLCYIESEEHYLMLYRNKKKNDPNAGKWIGIGGKLLEGEHPDVGMKREVLEETGLKLKSYKFLGVISFRSDSAPFEEMYLYTAEPECTGLPKIDCNEGEAEWIRREDILGLNLWEGDRAFLEPMMAGSEEINLLLRYEGDKLKEVLEAPAGKMPVSPIQINDRISYIPASKKPLSSEMVIIKGDKKTYIFDTGSTLADLEFLYEQPDDKEIIVSHFHGDHTWWLTTHDRKKEVILDGDDISIGYPPLKCGRILIGKYAKKHIPEGVVVDAPMIIEDGVKLEIIPFPSSHAKGCLILVVDNEYVFLGDATYPALGDEEDYYNAGVLLEGIRLLEGLKAENCGLCHGKKFIRNRKVVLRQLQAVYDMRIQGEPLIKMEKQSI